MNNLSEKQTKNLERLNELAVKQYIFNPHLARFKAIKDAYENNLCRELIDECDLSQSPRSLMDEIEEKIIDRFFASITPVEE